MIIKPQMSVVDVLFMAMAMLVASANGSELAEIIAKVDRAEDALGSASAAPKWPERTVLAFVTPWNGRGYELAIEGARRRLLSTVAPVWYQMNSPSLLLGRHDVKEEWLQEMKKAGKGMVDITPRVIFQSWTVETWMKVFEEPKEYSMKVAAKLVAEAEHFGYKGFVLEVWLQAAADLHLLNEGYSQAEMRAKLIKFIARLGKLLDYKGFKSILVVPQPQLAPSHKELQDLKRLGSIDALCVMTYDYNTVGDGTPRPNAPLFWVEQIISTFQNDNPESLPELLLGLNFYGYSYSTSKSMAAVTSKDYLAMISNAAEENIRIEWLEEYAEHVTGIQLSESEIYTVLFPSSESIQARVELAEKLGTGVSIWELGQGFVHFLDELVDIKRGSASESEIHQDLRK